MDFSLENICYPHLLIKPFQKGGEGEGASKVVSFLNLVFSIETFQSIYCPLGKSTVYKAEGSHSSYCFNYERCHFWTFKTALTTLKKAHLMSVFANVPILLWWKFSTKPTLFNIYSICLNIVYSIFILHGKLTCEAVFHMHSKIIPKAEFATLLFFKHSWG